MSIAQRLGRLTLLVLALATAACTRTFDTQQATRQLGQSCAGNPECLSGFCADGVCCSDSCTGTRACNLEGSVGRCVERQPGDPCLGDGQCGTDHCTDGVCCESACDGLCVTCALPDFEGSCQPVPDNTDPAQECPKCEACFGGVCGPARLGTDPKAECGAGKSCTANQDCGVALNQPCTDDSQCTTGSCIAWLCLENHFTTVATYPFLATDIHRTPVAVASSQDGAIAIMVASDDGFLDAGTFQYEEGNQVAVVGASPLGPWFTATLLFDTEYQAMGAVALQGRLATFALVSSGEDFPGLYTYSVALDGTFTGYELADPTDAGVIAVALTPDASQHLMLSAVTDTGALRLTVRSPGGGWSTPEEVATGVDGVASATADGQAIALYVANGQVRIHTLSGADEAATSQPLNCSGQGLFAAASDESGSDTLSFVLPCAGVNYLGAFTPGISGPARWRFVEAPATVPYYGLAGGDLVPVETIRPVGSLNGQLLFTGMSGNRPEDGLPGGFTNTIWWQPDGGLAYGTLGYADTGYSFVSQAGGPVANGAQVTAFDEVAFDGSPVGGTATLLLQTFHR